MTDTIHSASLNYITDIAEMTELTQMLTWQTRLTDTINYKSSSAQSA